MSIFTFYSYKGGSGRTMALANVGVALARRGKRVLLVDWDLEAPGLERYFHSLGPLDTTAVLGLLDLAEAVGTKQDVDWRMFVHRPWPTLATLHLLPAGRRDERYNARVLDFRWDEWYAGEGAAFLERMREEWAAEYDIVLIDSRTGITDIGGLCTILLPDGLVLLFGANAQSMEGAAEVARVAQRERDRLPVDRAPLVVLPVLSRVDSREEFQLTREWIERVTEMFGPHLDAWIPAGTDRERLVERVKLPHVPYFSFGEKLAVLEKGSEDPGGLAVPYQGIAELLEASHRAATGDGQGLEGAIRALLAPAPRSVAPDLRALLIVERANLDQVHLPSVGVDWEIISPAEVARIDIVDPSSFFAIAVVVQSDGTGPRVTLARRLAGKGFRAQVWMSPSPQRPMRVVGATIRQVTLGDMEGIRRAFAELVIRSAERATAARIRSALAHAAESVQGPSPPPVLR